MATEWLNSFINGLEKLIEKPPYLIFVFAGAIFVILSLITQRNLEQTWAFFMYAVGGTMWRYGERDFLRAAEKKQIKNFSQEKNRVETDNSFNLSYWKFLSFYRFIILFKIYLD